jgi:hypothetical protein
VGKILVVAVAAHSDVWKSTAALGSVTTLSRARPAAWGDGGRFPWFVGYPGSPMQNALISGFVIAGLSVAALAAFAQWEEFR